MKTIVATFGRGSNSIAVYVNGERVWFCGANVTPGRIEWLHYYAEKLGFRVWRIWGSTRAKPA